MAKRVKYLGYLILTPLVVTAVSAFLVRNAAMSEINFKIGDNIHKTAEGSGVPSFSVRNIEGFITYSVNSIPTGIVAQYTVPGFEISVDSIFAFTMYADEQHNNNLAVTTATLQFDYSSVKTHSEGHKIVQKIVDRFRGKKWKRYVNPDCAATTGRSSFLDEKGAVEASSYCGIDPNYRISTEDWIKLMSAGANTYKWIGNGVLATLEIISTNREDGVSYSLVLEFEDLEIRDRIMKKNLQHERLEGDAKGWNLTKNELEAEKRNAENRKILEENFARSSKRKEQQQSKKEERPSLTNFERFMAGLQHEENNNFNFASICFKRSWGV